MVWPKAIHGDLEIVSGAIFTTEVFTVTGSALYKMALGLNSHKNVREVKQVRQPWDIHSPTKEGEKIWEKGAEVKTLLNDKLLNQPNMKLSPFKWTGTHRLSQPLISNLPGSQQLGKPSFPQVQNSFPLGSAFLAKEKPPLWLLKIALHKKKIIIWLVRNQKFQPSEQIKMLPRRQDRLN